MPRATLRDLSRLFLKLGIFGFGGPAAHIATMEEEVVQRKHWLSERQFILVTSRGAGAACSLPAVASFSPPS